MTAQIAHAALSATLPLPARSAGNGTRDGQNGAQPHSGVNPGGTRQRRKDPRKQTVEHQGGFLVLMVRKFAERAKGEDPGYGLLTLMKIQAVVDQAVADVGAALCKQVGPSAMAEDLTVSTGEGWSKQRVHKRWGGGPR